MYVVGLISSLCYADWRQGHKEALNLVNVHRSTLRSTEDASGHSEREESPAASNANSKKDADLQRAKELVELHYRVKLKYLEEGPDAELEKARDDVKGVQNVLSRRKPA